MPERAAVKHAILYASEGTGALVSGRGAAAAAAAMEVESEEAVNWASPTTTFPIVVGLLAVPEYHDAIGESSSEKPCRKILLLFLLCLCVWCIFTKTLV